MSYSGTTEVERLLQVYHNKITIGTKSSDNLGTSDIRVSRDDAQDVIDGFLSDTIDSLPVVPTPGALRVSCKYLAAYFVHTSLFAANKPGKQSATIEGWKTLADNTMKSYKKQYKMAGKDAGWEGGVDRAFTERGVSGVAFGDRSGVFDDSEITDES